MRLCSTRSRDILHLLRARKDCLHRCRSIRRIANCPMVDGLHGGGSIGLNRADACRVKKRPRQHVHPEPHMVQLESACIAKHSNVTLVRSAPLITLENFVLQNKDSVVAGDSVQFEIWYRNAGTDSLRNVKIVDSIFNAGRSVLKYKHMDRKRRRQ